jgi:predicted permease
VRLFNLLLRLYPASFRAEYGGEMRAVFAARRRDAAGAGAAALWLETLADTLVNASTTHWDILRQDLRYTMRSLARTPGFALTVVAVAALGIGATTAAFSIADHVLVRPLPYHEPDRLIGLWQEQSFRGYPQMEVSPGNFRDWERMSRSWEGMGAYHNLSRNLVGPATAERLDGAAITPDLLTILGARAALGRTFLPSDEDPSAPNTVVLSHGVWQRLFNGDPAIAGRSVVLDDRSHTVVGVMPADFAFPSRTTEFWAALRFAPSQLADRTDALLNVVGRLKQGVTLDQARAEMQVIAAQLAREYPRANARNGAALYTLADAVSWRTRQLLLALAGASVCLLIIACTNLANLLLARALSRQKELAVRSAIGAGPERLVRQLMTESLVLAIAAGAGAVLLAAAIGPLFVRLVPTTLPIAEVPPLDVRVFAIAGALTLATGFGFGLFPALRVRRSADLQALREGLRGGTSPRTARLRSALVIAEVAACVVLLVVSGLLVRALWRVQDTDPGFRTADVLTLRTWLPMPKYATTGLREVFYDRVLGEVRALPGVAQAGYISFLPMTMRGGIWPVRIDGSAADLPQEHVASLRYVTEGTLEALSVGVRRGRTITVSDTRSAPLVAVVSESFARQHWPGRDPLGRRFEIAFAPRTIVGVVADIRVRGLERVSEPQVYLPARQMQDGQLVFYAPKDLAIQAPNGAALTPAIREIIARADPQQPISDVQTLEAVVAADLAPRRVQIAGVVAYAAVACLLAALGIHGLLAFIIGSQRREIGVRIALGARSRTIIALVLRRAVAWTAAGILVGCTLAFAAGRAMHSMLVGIAPADPPAVAAAVLLAAAMTLLGSIVPAVRALRVDPLVALRQPE